MIRPIQLRFFLWNVLLLHIMQRPTCSQLYVNRSVNLDRFCCFGLSLLVSRINSIGIGCISSKINAPTG